MTACKPSEPYHPPVHAQLGMGSRPACRCGPVPGATLRVLCAFLVGVLPQVSPALRAQTAGTLDPGFTPVVSGSYVAATVVQPDEKILVIGNFGGVNDQAHQGLGRLLPDGSVESISSFNPGTGAKAGTGPGRIRCAAIQTDGKIVVGGQMTAFNGQPINGLARLLPDGTLESASSFKVGNGALGLVSGVAVQPDGKILICGQLIAVNGQSRRGIARLLPDGTLESTATFNPGTGAASVPGADATVYTVALQPDGKIVIGGDFISFNGQPRNGIARLLPNGALESTSTFKPGSGVSEGAGGNSFVTTSLVQPDGKILISGNFAKVNGEPRNGFARLLSDGTVESTATFNVGAGPDGYVQDMALQSDGKILIGGGFLSIDGQPRSRIARLMPDGTVESTNTFYAGVPSDIDLVGSVFSVALQADGAILVGGTFANFNAEPRSRLARLANDPATQTLSLLGGDRVQWLRGGAAPEIEQAVFEAAANGGSDWKLLGRGTRIPGGWELCGLTLTGSGRVRGRGRPIGNSSNFGLIESIAPFSTVPSLKIVRSGDSILVTWPYPSTGFVLQENTALTPDGWSIQAEPVTNDGTNNGLSLRTSAGPRFYRLLKP